MPKPTDQPTDPHCVKHGHRLDRQECERRYGPCKLQPGVFHPAEPIQIAEPGEPGRKKRS